MRAPIGASNHGALFLHDDNDRTVGAKPHVIGGPLELRVLALDLCEQPRRDDARAGKIIADRGRSLLRKLEIDVLLAERVGIREEPNIGVTALRVADQLVDRSAALLTVVALVEAVFHLVGT